MNTPKWRKNARLNRQQAKFANPSTMHINMKRTILSLGGLLLGITLSYGQANISPAKAQSKPVIITGATIHMGNGQVINNGYITFDKGKITGIGEGAGPATGYEVVNAAGKQVYPWLYSSHDHIGFSRSRIGRARNR
jgi:ABC-type transport system substrate-binding protein